MIFWLEHELKKYHHGKAAVFEKKPRIPQQLESVTASFRRVWNGATAFFPARSADFT